ncbi:hypothetical protein D3C75_1106460 [compost metagenome]
MLFVCAIRFVSPLHGELSLILTSIVVAELVGRKLGIGWTRLHKNDVRALQLGKGECAYIAVLVEAYHMLGIARLNGLT